jgi:predicted GTPase/uncharacterized protein (DUF697 family)
MAGDSQPQRVEAPVPEQDKTRWTALAHELGSENLTARDPLELFSSEREQDAAELGRMNLLVLGKAGAGKSTLINAILRKPLARTGVGPPVTEHIKEYSDPNIPVTLFDSPGLELGIGSEAIQDEFAEFLRKRQHGDPEGYIHLVWYCIDAQGRRLEDTEVELIARVAREADVLLVLTQCRGEQDSRARQFAEAVQELGLATRGPGPVRVLAERREVAGVRLEPFGLEELAAVSYQLLPEAQQRAFANAQRVLLPLKVREARKLLPYFTAAAAGIAVVPTPVPSSIPITRLQLMMLGRITSRMGVDLPGSAGRELVDRLVGHGAKRVGRATAAYLMERLPGGNVINAGVAAGVTAALGEGYIQASAELIRRKAAGKQIPDFEIVDLLLSRLDEARGKRR